MAHLSIIRDLCTVRKITLKELSKRVEISEMGLQRILKTNNIKIDVLEKIADVLDVPVMEFFYPHALMPDDDIIFIDFIEDIVPAVLCKRNKKFSDKLSYYMDYFFLNIFPPDSHHRHILEIGMKLRYPFKHLSKPKYVFKRKDKSVYPKITNNIRELPFSHWPKEYQKQVKENNFLLESFYFPVFYFNLLNVVDYLNEGLLGDNELTLYWNEWQKIENEAVLLRLPLFINAYTQKPVYKDDV